MATRQKGGLGPKRKGDAFEAKVCADQERIGRVAFRVRQGGGEPVDVVSVQATDGAMGCGCVVLFIQCKATRPYLAPAEREAFIEKSKLAGAIPLVAWWDKVEKAIQYKRLQEVNE